MKELRRDPITGDISIYSSFRNKRPLDKVKTMEHEFKDKGVEYSEYCPFCRGNEKMNDDIKETVVEEGEWIAKSVANKFPIIDLETEKIFGEHEVIVESHRHDKGYYNMTEKEFTTVFNLLKSRYEKMSSVDGIKYVNIFKNSERNAGASLMHPHSQIVSFNMVPPEIIKEMTVAMNYCNSCGNNLYDDLVRVEQEYGKRVIYDGKEFIAFVPYATRYNGELRIIEKNTKRISDWTKEDIEELSYIFKNLFNKWEGCQGEMPFNMVLHTYPNDKSTEEMFRTHIHLIPRKYNFGGFELSSNLFVCGTDPDELAEALKFD